LVMSLICDVLVNHQVINLEIEEILNFSKL
jgi:hypothetical protein